MAIEHPEYSDSAYELNSDLVEAVLETVSAQDKKRFQQLIDTLHSADIADLLEQIGPEQREGFINLWGRNFDMEVVPDLEEKIRDDVVGLLSPSQIARSVRDLESDEIVDIVEDLGPRQKDAVLGALEESELTAVELSLQFPENTAGRLMQKRCVMSPENWTVGHLIDSMRSSDDLPEEFYHVILVSPRFEPLGQVSLGRLMASKRNVVLKDIVDEDFRTIPATQSQQDVAYAFNQYHLISTPVVDQDNRLVGIITIDDAMSVLDEEAEEDILRLAGVGDESLTDKVYGITGQRFPWLIVNLGTAILASLVIAMFADTIEKIVALAVLMPIVASMGGNAGTQSLTVAVRAIATKDLTDANVWRVIRREGTVGLLNGLIFAVIVGAIGLIWYGTYLLGVVLAGAMIVTMFVAGLAGILIPVILDRLRVDPAIASSVFVTTVTDVVGFLTFLWIAATVLL